MRREQKKLKEDIDRLADTTAEHLRLARRRPSSSTSEDGWQGEGGKATAARKREQQAAAEAAIAVERERIDRLSAEIQVIQRVQKGDSSMVRPVHYSV